jgi:hypothetical protein
VLAGLLVAAVTANPGSGATPSAAVTLTRSAGDRLALSFRNTSGKPINAVSFSAARRGFTFSAPDPASCRAGGDDVDVTASVACGDGFSTATLIAPGATFTVTFASAPRYPDGTGGTATVSTVDGGVVEAEDIPTAGPGAATPGGGALTLKGLKIKPTAFKAAGKGGSVVTSATGARVSFSLSQPATVKFTVERRKGKSKRYKTLRGSFSVVGKTGANKVRITGRLKGKRLKAGRYRLVARASLGSAKSRAARAKFRLR